MSLEERTTRQVIASNNRTVQDKKYFEGAITKGRTQAHAFVHSTFGAQIIEERCHKHITRAIEDGALPQRSSVFGKVTSRLARHRFLVARKQIERSLLYKEQIDKCERQARADITNAHKMEAQEQTVTFVVDELVLGLVQSVALDELTQQATAKERLETETGLVFPKLPHQTFYVHSALSARWRARKTFLKRRLEQLGARSTCVTPALFCWVTHAVALLFFIHSFTVV